MTEDDTFRILGRPPWDEMWEKYRYWLDCGVVDRRWPPPKDRNEWLKQFGWTWPELIVGQSRGIERGSDIWKLEIEKCERVMEKDVKGL